MSLLSSIIDAVERTVISILENLVTKAGPNGNVPVSEVKAAISSLKTEVARHK